MKKFKKRKNESGGRWKISLHWVEMFKQRDVELESSDCNVSSRSSSLRIYDCETSILLILLILYQTRFLITIQLYHQFGVVFHPPSYSIAS